MASADQLKALVKSHINRDDGQFYSVAMQVAAHEAKVATASWPKSCVT